MWRLRFTQNRGAERLPAEQLLEVVTPRTNTALISPAEHLCASLCLHTGAGGSQPVALEIVGDAERCRFVVRAQSEVSCVGCAAISAPPIRRLLCERRTTRTCHSRIRSASGRARRRRAT